jgi:DNA processing protein
VTPADERAAMVVLLRTGERPWAEYADLVEEYGSALTVLERESGAAPDGQTRLFLTHGSTDSTAGGGDAGPTAAHLDRARADLARWDAQGMRLVTVLESDYPPNLHAVHDRPPMVFVAGRLTPADTNGIAVVGARKASAEGAATARAISEHLVDAGYTVVSGLAAGIDTAAHTAAFGRNGRTVAVIGTGLARCYPPENASLQRRIASDCAVISQFWPDSPPSRRSFPMRNAVMSGLTLGTVVVEASESSGARMQARLALAQGRPVFLLESLLATQAWAREYAGRPATHVVTAPAEITDVVERLTSPGSLVA